jgi:hypothetical protein
MPLLATVQRDAVGSRPARRHLAADFATFAKRFASRRPVFFADLGRRPLKEREPARRVKLERQLEELRAKAGG